MTCNEFMQALSEMVKEYFIVDGYFSYAIQFIPVEGNPHNPFCAESAIFEKRFGLQIAYMNDLPFVSDNEKKWYDVLLTAYDADMEAYQIEFPSGFIQFDD